MGRLCHLVQVEIGDVEVRGALDTPVAVLAKGCQQSQLLAVLGVVTALDALRSFNRQRGRVQAKDTILR